MDIRVSVTPELARAFDSLPFDENAKVGYEYLSGGFCWSDETPSESSVDQNALLLLKLLIAHRASLILGDEKPEATQWWNEMKILFPNWPGFRPERHDSALGQQLRRAQNGMMAEFDHFGASHCAGRTNC